MSATIAVSENGRKYGYVYWHKKDDALIFELFGDCDSIEVVFEGKALGKKNIDWKNRRISVGRRTMDTLSASVKEVDLRREAEGRLVITAL